MTEGEFWDVIGNSRAGSQPDQLAKVRQALDAMSPEEIVAFDDHLGRQIDHAYDWDLWGAAYAARGGCGDDSFEYFRAWLVSRGRRTFGEVTGNPDSLVKHLPADPEEMDFEELLGTAWVAYEAKTGQELPIGTRESRTEPRGEDWDPDDLDEVRRRLPRLYAHGDPHGGRRDKPWWRFW